MTARRITIPSRNEVLIDQEGKPTVRFANWLETISKGFIKKPILGTGSPENVVEAEPTQFFVDTVAPALYYKDSGLGDTGWVLL